MTASTDSLCLLLPRQYISLRRNAGGRLLLVACASISFTPAHQYALLPPSAHEQLAKETAWRRACCEQPGRRSERSVQLLVDYTKGLPLFKQTTHAAHRELCNAMEYERVSRWERALHASMSAAAAAHAAGLRAQRALAVQAR